MLTNIKALILDMDGVLWKDDTPIGDLPAIFARIRERGLKVVLASNNATRTVDEYLAKLADFSVTLEPWQIVSSSLVRTVSNVRWKNAGSKSLPTLRIRPSPWQSSAALIAA